MESNATEQDKTKKRQEYSKKYYEDNKEKKQEYSKKYYEDNKEKKQENSKKYSKKYYEDNKEKKQENSKKYYEDNKEKQQENSKKYYEDNKEKKQEYYEDNKEKKQEYSKKYSKKYYEDNKEKKQEYYKKYYEDNKEQIAEKIPRCKSSWCNKQVRNNKYESYCMVCYFHKYPDNIIVRNYKTKERYVADYIRAILPDITWVLDRKIADGCSGRRPDILAVMGYINIIIEIDEDQHSAYDNYCEEVRINNLSLDLNTSETVMIRFNPDKYTDAVGNIIPSCWRLDGNGLCIIDNNTDWKNRLNILIKTIEPFLNPEYKQDEPLKTINLFY